MGKKMIMGMTAALMAGIMGMSSQVLGEAAQEEVTGEWYLIEMGEEGMSINPADFGMEILLILNEDSTCSMEVPGEESEQGTYDVSEEGITIHVEEQEDVTLAMLEDGTLFTEQDGTSMTFSREKPETVDWDAVLGSTLTEDAAIEDFAGTWQAMAVDVWGTKMPAEAAEVTASLTIRKDGTATLEFTDMINEEMVTSELSGDVEGYELILKNENEDGGFGACFNPNLLTLNLHDTGILENIDYSSFTEEGEEPEVNCLLYFERTEE